MVSVLWRFSWPAFGGPKNLVYIYMFIFRSVFIFIYTIICFILDVFNNNCFRQTCSRPRQAVIWEEIRKQRVVLELRRPTKPVLVSNKPVVASDKLVFVTDKPVLVQWHDTSEWPPYNINSAIQINITWQIVWMSILKNGVLENILSKM